MASAFKGGPGCCGCGAAGCTAGSCVQAFLDAGFPTGASSLTIGTSLGSCTISGSLNASPTCTAGWSGCCMFTAPGIDNTETTPGVLISTTVSFPVVMSLICAGGVLGFTISYLSDYLNTDNGHYRISGGTSPYTGPINCCPYPFFATPRTPRDCGGPLGCGIGQEYAPGDSVTFPLGSIAYPLSLSYTTTMPAFTGAITITAP